MNPAAEAPYMREFFHLIGVSNLHPRQGEERREVTRFPTLCGCTFCGGISNFYLGKEPIELSALTRATRKDLAYKVALVQHGYYMRAWESPGQNLMNRYIFPTKCSCTCEHVVVEKRIGNCMHEVKCTLCGETRNVDSSD